MTSLDVSDCTSLEKLICSYNPLTSLDVSGCTSLKYLSCYCNKFLKEIPSWFSQLSVFWHYLRYEYKAGYDETGEWVIKYEDRGYGWWYPGEPGKGKHEP